MTELYPSDSLYPSDTLYPGEAEDGDGASGDTKISDLPSATTLDDADEFVLASAGSNKKITGADLKASVSGGGGGGEFYFQANKPATTTIGAIWVDSDDPIT